MRNKFAATEAEQARPEMEELPPRSDTNVLQEAEIEKTINSLNNCKATGLDGIPGEAYKHSPAARHMLTELMKRIWLEEKMPRDFGIATFKMIYKRKGSPDNPAMYRCIGLLNTGYKRFSCIMLAPQDGEGDRGIPGRLAGRLPAKPRMP